ncbi:DNA damage response protein RcaA [Plenodomus tracheiphilus IPT5]|uniref:DNA damage response protein RcaA n=1 Tax=Plenodomus tracheiphilus IPT5 TaxID=1408161 RepID=A0A6A7BQ19_9PLEO|nr:DNA damage response protein RcaA [Plenodomus tracheiphilus IPT5]
MWFLEHESLFGGKRVWLRPGSQQLFGRTKSGEKDGPEGKQWKIDNKAVSRKHVMLKVYDALPENGTKLHTRSQIEVTDLSCRQGTTIDEKETLKSQKAEDGIITYDKTNLKGTEHTIRLAQGYAPFKIVWRPVVVTHASKESREGKARTAQLHALDIKTSSDFQFDKTTHVVSSKRNLPKVLSGLTAGKHIVTTDFLDAVLKAATPSVDAENTYIPSKLEEDFDTWWPKEKEYIPPIGAEPVPQPQEKLEPDPTRSEVFSGLTFIFLNDGQYSSLLEPITGGGGKALLYGVRPGETTVQEYIDYIHSVAGKKRRTVTSKDKLPVVTVRLSTYPDDMEEWATNFINGIDQALGQRSMLQNEFLDAIVTKDRSALQRAPADMPSSLSNATGRSIREATPIAHSAAPSQAAGESISSAQPVKAEPMKTIPRKRVQRPKTTSRFTGFDDYEPPPKKKKTENTQMEDVIQSVPNISPAEAASQSNGASTSQSHAPLQSFAHDTVEKEEQMDTLFPTAAKVRRERAATRAPSHPPESSTDSPIQESKHKGVEALNRLNRAKAKAEKDINVREHTRLRMKEAEERRKADEESLREALEGIDIAELKNLAQIEDMEIRRPRDGGGSARIGQSQGQSERWNPQWNGRKNFKKFRRRGAEHGVQAHKVIVTLEEAPPKKGFGIGDAFFLEDVEPSSKSRDGRRKQVDDSSEPEPGFTRRKRPTQQSEVINIEDSAPEDEEVPVVPRTQRSSGRTQRVVETQVDDTQTQRGKKRGTGGLAPEQPASKRGRVDLSRRDDDSDEEETGFRFKRRGK